MTLFFDTGGYNISSVTFTPISATTSTSFLGTAAAIPGTIQAADFDNGGEGVAYHDSTSGNAGGAYRATDVDIEASADGGFTVGWLAVGEWLKYSVNVATGGGYTFSARVAAPTLGGAFHLEMDGVDVSGAVSIPATGGWQAWQTVSAPVTLAAGAHVARLVIDASGPGGVIGNIGALQFRPLVASPPSAPPPGGVSTPYTGVPAAIPGIVRAEQFDAGPEGVAYHDLTIGNTGGAYRTTDVDIAPSAEGLFTIGWIDPGEWLNYTVTIAAAGSYDCELRVATPQAGRSLHVGFGAPSTLWSSVAVPSTGDWQKWTSVHIPLTLAAGRQLMTLFFDTGGYNISSVTFTPLASPLNLLRYVAFQASVDHVAMVTSYVFDVFSSSQAMTTPLASLPLGKPSPDVNGDITIDAASFFAVLPVGSYVGTVTAIGPGGRGQSLPVPFLR
jgi:hypothetical protein